MFGAVAAISLLASALPLAIAQGGPQGPPPGPPQGGPPGPPPGGPQGPPPGGPQYGNGGGGYHQDQSGQYGHQWIERTPSGGRNYHQQPSFVTHPYQGSEHRKYYTYQGSEFYINLDSGIRISL